MDRTKAILGSIGIVILLLGSAPLAGMQFGEMKGKSMGAKQTPESMTYSMTFSAPEVLYGEKYSYVAVEGADYHTIGKGAPAMPVVVRTFTFPFNTKILKVDCEISDIHTRSIDKKIAPSVGAVRMDAHAVSVKENKKIYSSSEPYPEKWFDYRIGVGMQNGKHVVFLTVEAHPARYFPASGAVEYTDKIDIKIEFKKQQSSFPDTYDLLIITPEKFADALQPLVEHKESHGIKTILSTTESIYQSSNGRDDAEKIKYFIKNAIEQWGVKYVLLVGGMKGQRMNSWYVPVRYSHLDDNSSWESGYASDLYYADIYKYDNGNATFEDWDSNGNGIFGEWNINKKDMIDMYPDVYIGRLPCRYKFEVETMVNKIINYEDTAYGQDWFRKMVVIGGDSFEDDIPEIGTDYIEGQVETEYALSFMDGFEHTRIWVEGGDIEFTPENAQNKLSEGEGFVYFSGHGNPASWATHPHNDFDTWIDFGLKNIRNLNNGEKLPVLVVGGCHNSQFNVSLLKFLEEGIWAYYKGDMSPECWGWLFTRNANGGSIATIGNTGLGYGTVGDGPVDEIPDSVPDGIPDCIQYLGGWMETHFFEVYNHYGKHVLGETWATTITDYLNKFPINWDMNWEDNPNTADLVNCKTAQEWVLFGDPSLMIGGYS